MIWRSKEERGQRLGRRGSIVAAIALLPLAYSPAAAVICNGPDVPLAAVCGTTLKPPKISCTVPQDAEPERQFNLFQRATDIFSWQAFVGLQWPASKTERGQPDPAATIGAPGPTVWETWREASEVFRHSADNTPLPPLAWDAASPMPAACAGADRMLFRTSKVDDMLADVAQPTGATATRPLTLKNQKGELTRYEIRMNFTAYQAITKNQWWNGARQATLASARFPDGSIIAKAAWVPVADADAARFHAINACVCDSADGKGCVVRKMGQVGFHLMSKTASAPQWFWSTFEQRDNVAGACMRPLPPRNPSPTYWNAAQGLQDINQQTSGFKPNQICRVYPISDENPDCKKPEQATDNVQALNTAMQGALARTPFRNYELVGTQWPVPGSTPPGAPHTQFEVLPQVLGNTTLESFIQGTSSCMGCHAMARTRRHVAAATPDGQAFFSSDFTFMLGMAQPAPAPQPLLRALLPGDCGGNGSDPKCLGLIFATKTYEQLPQYVGAKLHCTSCHLEGGRNPRASWWKDVVANYSTPNELKKGGIAGRINSCFLNSLNGKALCTPNEKGLCPDNAPMTALIAYMSWLAEPRNNPENIATPQSAFPAVTGDTGVRTRGAKVFLQKCAFCHGADGEGRYEDDTYFRPALWGPHSFNTSAGMDTTADLAPFVYGNMPFHSGGELSAQEARDLACFIDGKPRPKGPPEKNPSATTDLTCRDFAPADTAP